MRLLSFARLALSTACFVCPALMSGQRAPDDVPPPLDNASIVGTFTVDPGKTSCAVQGRTYTTALDCTIATALAYTAAKKSPAEVRLGPGNFDTKTGLQMTAANHYSISLHGAGKGEFGGGTVIRLTAPLSHGVISFPYLKRTGSSEFWSNVNLSGFTIDANGNAPMCFDLYALRVAHLSDLSCTRAIGTRSWTRIGGYSASLGGTVPQGYTGGSFQVMASDIFLYHNGYQPTALVEAQVSGEAIQGYKIVDAGRFRESSIVPVFLKGPDAATAPCRKMPQHVVGHVTADAGHPGFYKLQSITQDSVGEGCTLPVSVAVVDLPTAAYGFEIEATDSSFYDLTDDSVGTVAGIEDRVSGKALFVHPHVWNTWGGMELWGGETIVTPEFDSVYGYGVQFRYGSGSVVMNPTFVYLHHAAYDSVSDFLFAPVAKNMSISSQQCDSLNPNPGYVSFVGEGALDLGSGVAPSSAKAVTSQQRMFPSGFTARDISNCRQPGQYAPGVFVTSQPLTSLPQERRLSWSGYLTSKAATASFLLAELPAPKEDDHASLRVTLSASSSDQLPRERSMTLSNRTDISGVCNGGAEPVATAAKILAYRQPDDSLRIYLRLNAGVSATTVVDMLQSPAIHLEPEPPQVEPAGTVVFNSSSCEARP